MNTFQVERANGHQALVVADRCEILSTGMLTFWNDTSTENTGIQSALVHAFSAGIWVEVQKVPSRDNTHNV